MKNNRKLLREIFDNAQVPEDRFYKALQLATNGEISEPARSEVTNLLLKYLTPEQISEITKILSQVKDEVNSVLS